MHAYNHHTTNKWYPHCDEAIHSSAQSKYASHVPQSSVDQHVIHHDTEPPVQTRPSYASNSNLNQFSQIKISPKNDRRAIKPVPTVYPKHCSQYPKIQKRNYDKKTCKCNAAVPIQSSPVQKVNPKSSSSSLRKPSIDQPPGYPFQSSSVRPRPSSHHTTSKQHPSFHAQEPPNRHPKKNNCFHSVVTKASSQDTTRQTPGPLKQQKEKVIIIALYPSRIPSQQDTGGNETPFHLCHVPSSE